MRRVVGTALLALALGACGEDPVPGLRARRAALLESTVEKERFWAEVERKGRATGARRELEGERAALLGRDGALAARAAQIEEARARAVEVNARADDVRAEVAARADEEEAAVRALEETLGAWSVPLPEPEPDAPGGGAS